MGKLRTFLALAVVLLLLAGCARPPQEAKSRAGTFTNAVYIGTENGLGESPDPATLKFNGEYYTYVTGDPCRVLKSEDLIKWTYVGNMLEAPGSCWAPDVTYKNGTFYAYVATQEDRHIEGSRRVRLYTSATPEGPFVLKETVTRAYSYDPDYFMAEDGTEYLYWTQECGTMPDVAPCSGNANVGARLVDMTRLEGPITRVAHPEGWECRGRCILEAPSTLQRDGQYFQHYSGAAYENASYGGGYVRSLTPLGPGGPKDVSWVKQNQVLKSTEAKVDGPGGATWTTAPNNLEDWTVYHARGITRQDWDRWLRIDPVMWGRDRFWLHGAPSYEARVAPGMPNFRDLFNRPDGAGLGKDWATTGGTWSVAKGAALQADTAGTARALAGEAAAHYAFEANVGQISGSAGVVAYWADEKNQVTALIDRGARTLAITAVVGGSSQQLAAAPLPADFNFDAFHQLMVRKNGERFTFALDGRPAAAVDIPLAAPGKAGLTTVGGGAAFDGVALTHGWEDFFDGPKHGWAGAESGTAAAGNWSVANSVLAQGSAAGRAEAFKGARTWNSYAFTTSLRQTQGAGQVGVYAAYADPKNFVEALIDPKAGTLQVRSVLRGKAEMVATPLSEKVKEPLDFGAFHTLRVEKNGFQFRFWLDGVLVQERTIQIAGGQVGLLTQDAAAEYDSIQAVRWD